MRSRISQSLDLEERLMLVSKERKVYNLNALKKTNKGHFKNKRYFNRQSIASGYFLCSRVRSILLLLYGNVKNLISISLITP